LRGFKKYAAEMYGRRCESFDADCVCCKLWKTFDEVTDIVAK